MALQGTLKDFSLADIFQLIGVQKKTGVLTLKNQEEVATVSFLNGNVVAADSLPRKLEDRLGRVLVKTGRITEAQLQKALERQKQTLQRMGHLLVSSGFIGQEDLQGALTIQVTQMIFRLFRWRDGHYHFNQEDHLDYDRQNFSPIGAETILMEGARILDEWPLIEKKLKSFLMVFCKTHPGRQIRVLSDDGEEGSGDPFQPLPGPAPPDPSSEAPTVNRQEAIVYSLVDGKRNVQEVIDRCRLSEFDTCKSLYDLSSRNLIQVVHAVPEAVPGKEEGRTEKPIWFSPAVQKAAPLVLAVVLAALFLSSFWNPIQRSRPLFGGFRQVLSEWALAGSRARLERIQYAIQIYYLQNGGHPPNLDTLLRENLLREDHLRDPWNRHYSYERLPRGYRIWGMDQAGGIRPELTLEYRYPSDSPGSGEIALNR